MALGEMHWVTYPWPWPKVTAVASISKNLLVCTIKWEPLIGSLYCPSRSYDLIRFWRSFVGNFYFGKFFFKNFGCVFSRSNTILAISQEWLVRLMWNKKELHRLDTGYNMLPLPLTSLMTLTLDVSRSNFEISISGIIGLIDVKWKRSELTWYWADCMTLPFDHTHDLDPGVEISRSESEIALSQEWDGRLTWNEKDVSYPFMTMTLTSVTMVGWADVPDSDCGDFRCRRVVGISSFKWCSSIQSILYTKGFSELWIDSYIYRLLQRNLWTKL